MSRIGKFLFLAVAFYAALWVFWTLQGLYTYWKLDAVSTGYIQQVQVKELSTSRYDLLATYTYLYQGQEYTASTALGKPYQYNIYTAEKRASELRSTSQKVYLSHRDPSIASLKRVFPLQALLQAVLTVGITIYLWVLNLYYASPKNKSIRQPSSSSGFFLGMRRGKRGIR